MSIHQNSPIHISSPPAAVLETAPSKLIRVVGMAHCCLLVVGFVVVVVVVVVGFVVVVVVVVVVGFVVCCCWFWVMTEMRDGCETCHFLNQQPTYFSVGYALFTNSYILCHSF